MQPKYVIIRGKDSQEVVIFQELFRVIWSRHGLTLMKAALSVWAADRLILSSWWRQREEHRTLLKKSGHNIWPNICPEVAGQSIYAGICVHFQFLIYKMHKQSIHARAIIHVHLNTNNISVCSGMCMLCTYCTSCRPQSDHLLLFQVHFSGVEPIKFISSPLTLSDLKLLWNL